MSCLPDRSQCDPVLLTRKIGEVLQRAHRELFCLDPVARQRKHAIKADLKSDLPLYHPFAQFGAQRPQPNQTRDAIAHGLPKPEFDVLKCPQPTMVPKVPKSDP